MAYYIEGPEWANMRTNAAAMQQLAQALSSIQQAREQAANKQAISSLSQATSQDDLRQRMADLEQQRSQRGFFSRLNPFSAAATITPAEQQVGQGYINKIFTESDPMYRQNLRGKTNQNIWTEEDRPRDVEQQETSLQRLRREEAEAQQTGASRVGTEIASNIAKKTQAREYIDSAKARALLAEAELNAAQSKPQSIENDRIRNLVNMQNALARQVVKDAITGEVADTPQNQQVLKQLEAVNAELSKSINTPTTTSTPAPKKLPVVSFEDAKKQIQQDPTIVRKIDGSGFSDSEVKELQRLYNETITSRMNMAMDWMQQR